MNQNNGDICHSFIAAHFHCLAVIGIIKVCGAKLARLQCLFAIFIPN